MYIDTTERNYPYVAFANGTYPLPAEPGVYVRQV